MPKSRGQKTKLACENRRRVTAAPAAAKPAEVPAPPAAAPAEATHEQVAVGVAVNRAPEEHVFTFPLLGDEVWMLQQVVQQVCGQGRLGFQLLAEFVTLVPAAFLRVGQEQADVSRVPLQLAGYAACQLVILAHFPVLGHERLAVAVNDVLDSNDVGRADEHSLELRELLGLGTHLGNVIGCVSRRFQCVRQLVHLAYRIQCRHCLPLSLGHVLYENPS